MGGWRMAASAAAGAIELAGAAVTSIAVLLVAPWLFSLLRQQQFNVSSVDESLGPRAAVTGRADTPERARERAEVTGLQLVAASSRPSRARGCLSTSGCWPAPSADGRI